MAENKLLITGKILNIIPSYSLRDNNVNENGKYHKVILEVVRPSNNVDTLPLIIKNSMMYDENNNTVLKVDDCVQCNGVINMINTYDEDNKSHTVVYSFVNDFKKVDLEDITKFNETNVVNISGKLCKDPTFRSTPSGKLLSDMIVAVKRNHPISKRIDFLPVIAWGVNAKYAHEKLKKGDEINITGRFQSRNYMKNDVLHTVYEISVTNFINMEKVTEDNKENNNETPME